MKNLIAIIFTLITTVGFTQTTVEEIIRDYKMEERIYIYTGADLTDIILSDSLELREEGVFLKIKSWCGEPTSTKIKLKGYFDIYTTHVDGYKYVVYFLRGESISGKPIHSSVYITRNAAFNRELLPKR